MPIEPTELAPVTVEELHLKTILTQASAALRAAAYALVQAQQGKIKKLRHEIEVTTKDITSARDLATSLEGQRMSPNRVRGLRARVKHGEGYIAQCEKGIAVLEAGFIPIPYLDYTPAEHWQVKRVPYRVLKAIEEGGLKNMFDELGIVEPQTETLSEHTFREPVPGDPNKIHETKILGRVLSAHDRYIQDKDPMLIGRLRIGKHDQWFMIGVWNDWIAQLG